MNLTIRINDTGTKARSIINMLKNLADDYDFIEIFEDTEKLPELTNTEYLKRYKYTLKHIGEGLTINEMEKKLYSDEKKKV
jgi:hypothetical protein